MPKQQKLLQSQKLQQFKERNRQTKINNGSNNKVSFTSSNFS